MSNPYYSDKQDLASQKLPAYWYRHGGLAAPGTWYCFLSGLKFGSHHNCVMDDFGTLVEVPA
jgi:hypothetical protein